MRLGFLTYLTDFVFFSQYFKIKTVFKDLILGFTSKMCANIIKMILLKVTGNNSLLWRSNECLSCEIFNTDLKMWN